MAKKISLLVLLFVATGIILDASSTFFSPAVSASYSGPLSVFGWIILIGIFMYMASCFAELSSMFPSAGGIYEFTKHSYGRLGSFIIGWIGWLIANIAIAVGIVGANQYLFPANDFFHIILKLGLSLITIIVLNYIAYRGIEEGSIFVTGFIVVLVITILAVIIPALFHFKLENFQPLFVFEGWRSNLLAFFTSIFFASQVFFGMEEVTYLSEDVEEPQKNMPKALLFANLFVGLILLVHVVVSLGYLNWAVLGSSNAPYLLIVGNLYNPTIAVLFKFVLYFLMVGAAMGAIMSTPYLLMAMSRDQLFMPQFAKRHPKYNSPYKAIIFQSIAIFFFVTIGIFGKGFESLSSMLVPLSCFIYAATILSVLVLRFKKPEIYRHFKAPFGKWMPVIISLFLAFVVGMWLYTEPNASNLFNLLLSTVLLGFPIYFLIEMYYDPKMITSVNDLFSHLIFFLEDIILPKKVREKIIALAGDISGKKVLEFGCSVGTLTKDLAKKIGYGIIYATDISKHRLKITERRINREGHKNVNIIHDDSQSHRVHPSIPEVDMVISAGILGYVQNVDRVLRELNHRLKVSGRICILEYDKFFGFIPNMDWLGTDEAIIKKFEDNGFSVNVIRKKGILWTYVYIYGEKSRDIYKYHYVTI